MVAESGNPGPKLSQHPGRGCTDGPDRILTPGPLGCLPPGAPLVGLANLAGVSQRPCLNPTRVRRPMRALSLRLAAEGWAVAAVDVDDERLAAAPPPSPRCWPRPCPPWSGCWAVPEAQSEIARLAEAAGRRIAVLDWAELTGRMVDLGRCQRGRVRGGCPRALPRSLGRGHGTGCAAGGSWWSTPPSPPISTSTAFPNAFETRERFHRWMDQALAATAAGEEAAWTVGGSVVHDHRVTPPPLERG